MMIVRLSRMHRKGKIMNKFIKFALLSILLSPFLMEARYKTISTESDFFTQINRYEFSIVCFLQSKYDDDLFDRDERKALKREVSLLHKTIKAASETRPFRKILKKEVGFIVVDISKRSMQSIVEKYKIGRVPQFLLFEQGEVLDATVDNFQSLFGFVTKADILELVDDYFGDEIDEIVSQKEEDAENQREENIARYNAYSRSYYNPYYSWGPYGYYGYARYGYGPYSFRF